MSLWQDRDRDSQQHVHLLRAIQCLLLVLPSSGQLPPTRSDDCETAEPSCWVSLYWWREVDCQYVSSWRWAPGGWRMPPPSPPQWRHSRTWRSSPRSCRGLSSRAPSPAWPAPGPRAGPACSLTRGLARRTAQLTWRSSRAPAWPPPSCPCRWSPPRIWWRPCTWCSSAREAWSCPDLQRPRYWRPSPAWSWPERTFFIITGQQKLREKKVWYHPAGGEGVRDAIRIILLIITQSLSALTITSLWSAKARWW